MEEEWINIDNKLPKIKHENYGDNSNIVKLKYSNGVIAKGYFFKNYGLNKRSGFICTSEGVYHNKAWSGISVTHWTPLPEAPKL